MGLITEFVTFKNKGLAKKYYKNKAVSCDGETFLLRVTDLTEHSSVKVQVQCDYCGKVFEQGYGDYLKINKNINKVACLQCSPIKLKEVCRKLYGVDNASQLDEVKQKKIETCQKNFGCMYPMQSKQVTDKSKISMKEKYGVEHNFYRPEIIDIVRTANSRQRYENGTIMSSKAQRHLCELYNAKLNYSVGFYNLDMLLEENLYLEYNGSGHDMNVKRGQISRKEFERKEYIRYTYLKKMGYKVIIFDNLSNKLPNDNELIDLKNKCVKFLKLSDSNWIRVDLDKGVIKTKNTEIFYTIS